MYDDLLTTYDVACGFNVTAQTINNWRDYKGLPVIRIRGTRRDTIRYDRDAIIKWGIENGKSVEGFQR